jgi:hypothetical protein
MVAGVDRLSAFLRTSHGETLPSKTGAVEPDVRALQQ